MVEIRMALYRFIGYDEEILYIGKSKNIYNRIMEQQRTRKDDEKQERNLKTKYIEVCYFEIGYDGDADIYEMYLINKHKPRYNKDGKRKGAISVVLPELEWKKEYETYVRDGVAYFASYCDEETMKAELEKLKIARRLTIEIEKEINTL